MLSQAKWIWPWWGHKYWRVIVHNCCNFGWCQLKLFWAMSRYFAAVGHAKDCFQCWWNCISSMCVVVCSPAPKAALMLSVGISRDTLKETSPVSFRVCSFFPNLLHRKGKCPRTLTFFESLLSLRAHDLTLEGPDQPLIQQVWTYYHCQKSAHLWQLLFLKCS